MTDIVPVQTSVPDWVMAYCRQLSDVYYRRKLNRMYVYMLEEGFLKLEPWKASPPFPWRAAKSHTSSLSLRPGSELGWVPLNMVLPLELAERIRVIIEEININGTEESRKLSMRTFLFTAIYWWCTVVYPYNGPGVLPD